MDDAMFTTLCVVLNSVGWLIVLLLQRRTIGRLRCSTKKPREEQAVRRETHDNEVVWWLPSLMAGHQLIVVENDGSWHMFRSQREINKRTAVQDRPQVPEEREGI